jgi:2-polyprenyl-3-methyl-5-hydroxy-6-metoxy-1,4-benzoquinol methylase
MGDGNSNNYVKCPICEQPIMLCGHADYYDRTSHFRTPIYFCKYCNIFYRDINTTNLLSHFYAASYVQKQNEQLFFDTRINFFEYILSLVKRYAKTKHGHNKFSFVDFGSSYGHLIELAKNEGIEAAGIEINEDLIKLSREKGLQVYQNLSEVSKKVDAVTSIDSLYYAYNPQDVMLDIKNCLKPDGIFVARITNRNLYAKLKAKFIRKDDYSTIGDATVSYSLKGIKKLLSLAGFDLVLVVCDYGKGKQLPLIKTLCYRLCYLLTLLTCKTVIITPGIIVIAKPSQENLQNTNIE